MPVRPEPEQHQIEARERAELPLVGERALILAELALHAVARRRRDGDAVDQRDPRHVEVRPLVVGRCAPLVAPPELDARPVLLELRGQLVRALRRRPAREHDLTAHARGLGKAFRHDPCGALRVVGDDDLDVAARGHAQFSCESSRARFIAAWIALRNAARTPACSSSRIAAIVVPPGEVTDSRSSTGCMPSSRSCFAVPSIV